MANPRFQVITFDSSEGMEAMENAANAFLAGAWPEMFIVDRQTSVTSRTSFKDPNMLEPFVVLTIWYTTPPIPEVPIARAFDPT